MSNRRSSKRPWGSPHREFSSASLLGVRSSEEGPDGRSYQVQKVGPGKKEYRCPGCLQAISVGTPHIVAWPEEANYGLGSGVEARRHWHLDCWRRKLRPN